MLPRNHLLKFAPRRAISTLKLIKRSIWQTQELATVSEILEDGTARPIEMPHHWGRIYKSKSFSLSLPSAQSDCPRWLRWMDQAESTLYIDGEPYFGFDVAHRECQLPDTFSTLKVEATCIQSAIWHEDATGIDPNGSKLQGATFLTRSEIHWKLYHDLLVLIELLGETLKRESPDLSDWMQHKGVMPDDHDVSPFTRQLIRSLETFCNLYDQKKLNEASASIDATFKAFPAEAWNLDATITGHSHIDLVWMWPESVGETKAIHTFTNVDYLMDQYPEFTFGYSQPASYDAVKRLDSKLYDRVGKRISEGRWEAYGAMYVESDTILPCGEALARSFELGQEGFTELNGKPSNLCWLPDVFGYSGSLPQLMNHYGVTNFFTNKVTWNEGVVFQHNSFRWIGTDGAEVLSHIHPETVQFYNGYGSVEEIQRAQRRHHQADTHKELLIPTGFGDGGGGPTEEMCERVQRFQSLAHMPRCKWGTIEGFYDRLEKIQEDLPAYYGEILIQKHRGTYTSRSTFKSKYRQAEYTLQLAEVAAAATQSGPIDKQWWKRVVFSQFHDILPGSSVTQAYAELDVEFKKLNADVESFTVETLKSSERKAFFNPTPFTKRTWVDGKILEIEAYQSDAIENASDESLPTVRATENTLASDRLNASFNTKGEIESLEIDGLKIETAGELNQLHVYPNRPHEHQAWELDRTALSLGIREERKATASINRIHDGLIELSFSRTLGDNSSITVTYRCDALKPYLEINYDVNWQEEHAYLKAVMPTEYRGDNVRYGQAVGSALRNQNPRTITDEVLFEVPASRWALISDDGEREGLSIITENKYGFSARYGTVGVSLLSSPLTTGEGPGFQGAFPNSLRDDVPENTCSDIGRHSFKLILAPWKQDNAPEQHPAALADYAFVDALPCGNVQTRLPLRGLRGLPSVFIFWIQPSENGSFIVKTAETMGARGEVTLLLDEGLTATPINGLKQETGPAIEENRFEAKPYKLNCFLIR